ncbi:MAG: putative motility protein [Desulfobacterales bacterium]|nr:putative motility protein [Desulfobacterales bacterium]
MSVSVLKQKMDAEQQQAQALIKMMNQSPCLGADGARSWTSSS